MLIWNLVDILKAKLEEGKKVKEVDPELTKAKERISSLEALFNQAQDELKVAKRELILNKLKHAKGEKSKAELEAEWNLLNHA